MATIRPARTHAIPLLALAAAVLAALALTWFVRAPSNAESQPAPTATRPTVVCTTQMIADLVRRVAGDRIHVAVLMGPGVDPHLYHPTRADTLRIASADLVFYNGLHLEGKMTELFERASSSRPVVAVTDALPEEALLTFAGQHDPHVWMDPALWSRTLDVILPRLTALLPEAAVELAANADAARAELSALDEYAKHALATVPESQRILMTAHDAFGYFGRAYNYEVVGIQGISTESEAGLHDLQSMIDMLVERRIPAVFIESTIAPRNVSALRDGALAKGHTVTLGGMLFSDAAGPADTYEGTYVGMIDHNITTIVRALGGSAPIGGMNNRLAQRP